MQGESPLRYCLLEACSIGMQEEGVTDSKASMVASGLMSARTSVFSSRARSGNGLSAKAGATIPRKNVPIHSRQARLRAHLSADDSSCSCPPPFGGPVLAPCNGCRSSAAFLCYEFQPEDLAIATSAKDRLFRELLPALGKAKSKTQGI